MCYCRQCLRVMTLLFLLLTTGKYGVNCLYAMKLTQQQVRELVGIAPETFRYWRRALPPLREKEGKAAQFSCCDLLALLITKHLIDDLHISVNALKNVSYKLFDLCRVSRWNDYKGKVVCLDLVLNDLDIYDSKHSILIDHPVIVFNIELFKNEVNKSILHEKIDTENLELFE